jgi:transposase
MAEQELDQAEEEPAELVARAAAIDVAKDSGMVCTRVPHESRAGRRVQKVWSVPARFAAVTELADHLRCEGIERVVLEATSDYWRIWLYLLEAAGLQVWLVNARDVKNVPGRPKTDKLDSIWLCKLNERGMLRPSFVPPEEIRDLRALTRLRTTLTAECSRHKQRAEKILEDALVKVSAVVSELFGKSGRAMMRALVAGERDPKVLAGLALGRLRPKQAQLAEALTGRFRDVHAYEIGLLLDLVETLEARITELDGKIEAHLAALPGVPPACASCGLIGGGHAPGCGSHGAQLLSLVQRLDEITGVGVVTAQVIIAELGLDMGQFPTAGHASAWAKLSPQTIQSGARTRAGKTGKGNRWLRGTLGDAAMAAGKTDTYLGERYRRIRRRRGKQKAIVATARAILEIAYLLISNRDIRYHDLGPGYYDRLDPQRQTRNKIRELERLNPGMKVTLAAAAA